MHTSEPGSRSARRAIGGRRGWASLLTAGLLAPLALPLTALAPVAVPRVHAAAAELFFSEYIEGSSNNKALEIHNATGAAIDLTVGGGYNVQMFFNGNPVAALTINLTGSVADGDVFVLAQSSANAAILAQADQTNGSGWFNGDDAVVLRNGTTVVDVIGQIGFDPGTEWGSGVAGTADNTLRRKSTVCSGDAGGTNTFDPSVEWDGFAIDTVDGLGSHTSNCGGSDTAPGVQSTSPAAGASGVSVSANLTVTFTEPVDVTGSWFTLSCATSGAHAATVSGGPTVFTLDPTSDFAGSEVCTLAVLAGQVNDQDGNDPPDTMTADVMASFTTTSCGEPSTPIAEIQSDDMVSPLAGSTGITTEAVVTGDHQGATGLNGFFLQDPAGDGNPATSEGLFVFVPAANALSGVPVAVGDTVRVTGRVVEFQEQTELDSVTGLAVCRSGSPLPATPLTLPETTNGDLERLEGMYVSIAQTLTVQQNFFLGRFGQVTLASGGRLATPTDIYPAGSAEAIAEADSNFRRMIVLDDAKSSQNPNPIPFIGADNTLRAGDTVSGVVGNLDFGAVNSSSLIRDYRIQPTAAPTFTRANERSAVPAPVGGLVKVASFNVLNYFNGNGLGGGFPTARGATNAAEFVRQRDKIIAAITAMDASIVGVMEIENDPSGNSAIEDLVAGLNAASAPGTYSFIDTGVVGGDEIRVGLVYRPAEVTPVGAYATLTSAVDPLFDSSLNRPALAQTFQSTAGHIFTVVVNHLKSKGSVCAGDPDTGDGQGNCNQTRVRAATALANWIAADPTSSGDPDFLLIGDLNSYAKEDPILTLEAAGFVNLVEQRIGPSGYSYIFDGMSGSLDHALATGSFAGQVTGVTDWHINADEPSVIDYNTEFKPQDLYTPSPFRSSDHDPVIVGVCPTPTLSMSVTPEVLLAPNHKYRTVTATATASSDVVDVELVTVTSDEPDNGLGDGDTAADIVIVDDLTVRLRAERSGTGDGRTYTLTWRATNSCGSTATATATVTVPKG